MAERDRNINLRGTPGGIITSSAFDYAVKFCAFADGKYPELKQYPIEARYAAHQAAIVVSTLILLERKSGGAGWKELHDNVSRAFAPSARHRCLTAVNDLTAYLLKSDRSAVGPDAIPSFASLAGVDDKQLGSALGSWLGGVIMDKWTLGAAHQPIVAAMSRSAWTSAVMIVRKLGLK